MLLDQSQQPALIIAKGLSFRDLWQSLAHDVLDRSRGYTGFYVCDDEERLRAFNFSLPLLFQLGLDSSPSRQLERPELSWVVADVDVEGVVEKRRVVMVDHPPTTRRGFPLLLPKLVS